MPELGSLGSVRGASSNERPYREQTAICCRTAYRRLPGSVFARRSLMANAFKGTAGIGPQRYITQRRLERAKALMRRTHQPLALIAQEAGFADQSHLTSIFRREMGVTPGRFRAALT